MKRRILMLLDGGIAMEIGKLAGRLRKSGFEVHIKDYRRKDILVSLEDVWNGILLGIDSRYDFVDLQKTIRREVDEFGKIPVVAYWPHKLMQKGFTSLYPDDNVIARVKELLRVEKARVLVLYESSRNLRLTKMAQTLRTDGHEVHMSHSTNSDRFLAADHTWDLIFLSIDQRSNYVELQEKIRDEANVFKNAPVVAYWSNEPLREGFTFAYSHDAAFDALTENPSQKPAKK